MYKCEHCNDGKIKQGKTLKVCPYCITEDRLMAALKRTIADYKKEGKNDYAGKLQIVLGHLPEYPVMALLEAEYLGLSNSLIMLIRDSFQVLPFGDQIYEST